jgi:peptide/nickel transport system substrate-binding protein
MAYQIGYRTGTVASILAFGAACLGTAGLAPAHAQEGPGRVVVALTTTEAETNRYWGTAGILGLNPSMQMLLSNDPVTGEYDDQGLAERFEHNADFTEWTFYLHKGVPWHNGWGEVTAADVVHSYELHTGDDSTLVGINLLRGAELEVIDDHTVKFVLPEPRVNFLFAHGTRGLMFIYSKAQYDAEGLEGYDRLPAGTGHYRYVERRMGEGILFEKVEDHWSGQDAQFDELEFRWAAEPATKLAMILSGEAHISDLPRELHPEALSAGMTILASSGTAMQIAFMMNGLYMRTGDPAYRPDLPWADVRIREAMNRAVNRPEMLDVLYDGRAGMLVRYAMDPRYEGYVPELVDRFEAEYGYDPERAKALLAEAGYPDAFPDPVIPIALTQVPGSPEWATIAELLQLYFEAVGLQTELRESDFASLQALGRGRQAYLLNPTRNSPVRPTEVGIKLFYSSTGSATGGLEDDVIEELGNRLQATIDPQERAVIAREAFVYLFEQYADLPIAELNVELVANPEVVGGWTFPGLGSVGVSHWHLIEAAR